MLVRNKQRTLSIAQFFVFFATSKNKINQSRLNFVNVGNSLWSGLLPEIEKAEAKRINVQF